MSDIKMMILFLLLMSSSALASFIIERQKGKYVSEVDFRIATGISLISLILMFVLK